MRNILRDLYNGHFTAFERRVSHTKESAEVYRKIENEKGYFMQKMSLNDSRRFEALENLFTHASDFEQADAFAYGFKLGVMLMCAVFTDESEPQYTEITDDCG